MALASEFHSISGQEQQITIAMHCPLIVVIVTKGDTMCVCVPGVMPPGQCKGPKGRNMEKNA